MNDLFIIGWIRRDQWCEIDERNEPDDALAICDQCGQDIDTGNAYVAAMSNGSITGPYCAGCAVSE